MPLDCPLLLRKVQRAAQAVHPSSATAMATAAHNASRRGPRLQEHPAARLLDETPRGFRRVVAAAMGSLIGEQPAADRLGHARLVGCGQSKVEVRHHERSAEEFATRLASRGHA